MTASDCRSLFSCQYPSCHPRRLSPTPVPDLIGDPIKEWIQSSRGSSVFGLCLFPFVVASGAAPSCRCFSFCATFCHPRGRLSDAAGSSSRGSRVSESILFPRRRGSGHAWRPQPRTHLSFSLRHAWATSRPADAARSFCHPGLDPGSSVFVFAFSPPVILANAGIQRLFFVFVLCSCSRVIPGQSQGHAS